jgi:ABC-type multidrug transport system fused ATPase/permease subunit
MIMKKQWFLFELWGWFVRRYAAAICLLIALGLLQGCCSLLLPLYLGEFLFLHFKEDSSRQAIWQWLGLGHTASISQFLLLFFGLIVLRILLTICADWLRNMLGFRFAQWLICDHARQLSVQVSGRKRKLAELKQQRTTLKQWMQKGILDVPMHSGFFVLLIVLLHQLHAGLLYVSLAAISGIAVLAIAMAAAQRPAFMHKRTMQSKLNKELALVLTSNNAAAPLSHWKSLLRAMARYQWWQASQRALRQHTLYLVLGVLMTFMVFSASTYSYDAGTFIIFWLVLLTGITPIRGLLQLPALWSKARVASRYLSQKTKEVPSILPVVVTL